MEHNVKKVCTIGPASAEKEVLEALVDEGMSVARLNFSHGSYEDHGHIIDRLKEIRKEKSINLGILQDLSGPKIRIGELSDGPFRLEDGEEIRLFPGSRTENVSREGLPVSYENLTQDVEMGKSVLIDDGLIRLKVKEKLSDGLLCRVEHGGEVSSHKGVNFPDQILSDSAPTKKDLEDLEFGLARGVDFVALSFVQTPEDIDKLKEEMKRLGRTVPVIAKIERSAAVSRFEEILKVSDGIMVARGDLGIEADLSMIPVYQKQIVRTCNYHGKPVITATQMLDSMIRNPTPTRAEVTDVANAIYDGTDAVMLSGETAMGKYPVEAVRMMRRISRRVEEHLGIDRGWTREEKDFLYYSEETALAGSAVMTARTVDAKYIIVPTMTGQTAKLVAMHRPSTPIIAVTPNRDTYYQLSIVWGVEAMFIDGTERNFLDTIGKAEKALIEAGVVEKGDTLVVTAGIPSHVPGGTNVMKVHRVGEWDED